MGKRLTTEEFIEKARKVHGSKYDYSKVAYKKKDKKVCIICPVHGEFWQMPCTHLRGHGCQECGRVRKRTRVCKIGINDLPISDKKEAWWKACYSHWIGMLARCKSENSLKRHPTYSGCSVCDEWCYLSKFKEWFLKHYKEGWHLDKDILVKGNKVYSPDTCCFVPHELNNLVLTRARRRGKYPIGVCYIKWGNRYGAFISSHGKARKISGYFKTPEEAFYAYKEAKEAWIKEIADKWKEQIEPRVYEAMYNWKVEITD